MHIMLSNAYVGVYFACADDGIGRFDRSTVSQQDLMELFIFGLNEPEKICGSREDPDDVCEWTGVKCYADDVCEWEGVTCNADGEVEEFHWMCKNENGTGTLGFEFLPWSIKYMQMFYNALSGTIQLADLPGKIWYCLLLKTIWPAVSIWTGFPLRFEGLTSVQTNSPEKSPSKTFRNASNIYRSLKII